MLSAVIFDFDGVIADTEPLHYEAFQAVLNDHGLSFTWEQYQSDFMGFDDRDGFREMFKKTGRLLDEKSLADLVHLKARVFGELAGEADIHTYPGVLEMLESLSGRVPAALCSGALRCDILPILDKLGMDSQFDVMVTAEDVSKSKPDPVGYELAVSRLSEKSPAEEIASSACLAVEDTVFGVAAARSAGCIVLGVANTCSLEELRDATKTVSTLEGINLSLLEEWFSE